jgi:hypothetical protein
MILSENNLYKDLLKRLKDDYEKNYELINKNANAVQKKGKFNYLSVHYANKFLKSNYPEIIAERNDLYLDKLIVGVNLFIYLENYDKLILHSEFLAMQDFNNKPIAKADANNLTFEYQRVLAKAIAILTGYGQSLYTNEDLDYIDKKEETEINIRDSFISLANLVPEKLNIADEFIL